MCILLIFKSKEGLQNYLVDIFCACLTCIKRTVMRSYTCVCVRVTCKQMRFHSVLAERYRSWPTSNRSRSRIKLYVLWRGIYFFVSQAEADFDDDDFLDVSSMVVSHIISKREGRDVRWDVISLESSFSQKSQPDEPEVPYKLNTTRNTL